MKVCPSRKNPVLITKKPPMLVPFYLKDEEGNLDLQSWDGKTGFLDNEWHCYYRDKDIEFLLAIYKHFKTNLGSVPPPFNIAIEDGGELAISYIMHDFFYGTQLLPRYKVDDILYQTRGLCGGYYLANQAVYHSVRIFGGSYWDACSINDKGETDYSLITEARKFGKLTLRSCSDKLLSDISTIDINIPKITI